MSDQTSPRTTPSLSSLLDGPTTPPLNEHYKASAFWGSLATAGLVLAIFSVPQKGLLASFGAAVSIPLTAIAARKSIQQGLAGITVEIQKAADKPRTPAA